MKCSAHSFALVSLYCLGLAGVCTGKLGVLSAMTLAVLLQHWDQAF